MNAVRCCSREWRRVCVPSDQFDTLDRHGRHKAADGKYWGWVRDGRVNGSIYSIPLAELKLRIAIARSLKVASGGDEIDHRELDRICAETVIYPQEPS